MRWSIRYQLLVPLLTLLLSVVVGITAWSAAAAVRRERQQIDAQARDIALTLIDLNLPLREYVLKRARGLSGAELVAIEPSGRYHSTLPEGEELTERPVFNTIAEKPQDLGLGSSIIVAGHRYLGGAVRIGEEPNQGWVLCILYPESQWRNALWDALLPSLVLGTLGLFASVAAAVALAQRLSRRIGELGRRTGLIAAGDFSPMPLPRRDDELRDLSQAVNDMVARLGKLQDTIKQTERLRLLGQVGGGLAHQLRNGVTGARLALQLHARECPGADAEPIQVALRQLDLVEANLKRFLDLGRDDIPRRQPCSLTGLVGEAVLLFKPQCQHAHIDLRWEPGEDIQLFADPGQLGHLLHNVLGNAVEAAGPGGWVEVAARREPKAGMDGAPPKAIIEISDSGPGPAADVADRLFEPFVTGKREGVGLGLAVAHRVADLHGGSLVWRREADRTCFCIELPLAKVDQVTSGQGNPEP